MNEIQKPGKKSRAWVSIAMMVALFSAYAAYRILSSDPESQSPAQSDATAGPSLKIPVEDHFYVNIVKYSPLEQGYCEVYGTVKNISSRTFNYVKVKAEFLDENGSVLGEETTYASGQDEVSPDQMKSFKMTVEEKPGTKTVRGIVIEASPIR